MNLNTSESQNIEFKQIFKDEYIKTISAFANSDGGKLYIGVTDNGEVVGIGNAKKLLEDIPNKVRDIIGILVDVNLFIDKEKEYLEISTQSYPSAISYKGSYYYRSGSSTQELKGYALERFLLKKQGLHWDSVVVPNTSMQDIDSRSIELFISKAIRSKRMDENDIPQNSLELLDKLRLIEKGELKRAGLLLFAKDSQRFFTGAYTKIAYFQDSADILYQDVCEGNLVEQADKVIDLLFTKYLKALISYEGMQRVEEFDYEPSALREVVYNAIVHKDYSSGVPIQIGVFKNKLFVYNSGQLPDLWTLENITSSHRSQPYNPNIANTFFKMGLIESWGRGVEKVIKASKIYNGTEPIFTWDNGLNVEFVSKYPKQKDEKLGDRVGKKVGDRVGDNLTDNQNKILEQMRLNPKISAKDLSKIVGIASRNIEENIKKLKDMDVIQRIGSAKGGYWELLK